MNRFFLALVFGFFLLVNPVHAGWPARVFAPYVYLGADDGFKITRCAEECGQKFFTLAFIIADDDKNPAWDGRFPLASNLYAGEIRELRRRGGDVIVSFGGEGGTELARAETNEAALEGKYEAVITRYQLTWLDFDIEGHALRGMPENHRRNLVLARLQAKHPGLLVSYTLPVAPDGVRDESLWLLKDARKAGVRVRSVNLMTMDYGDRPPPGQTMGDLAVVCLNQAREQFRAIDATLQFGVTPMIGNNDEKGEVFTLADARRVNRWAAQQPWVVSLSFWSANRDNGRHTDLQDDNSASGLRQETWDFTRIFAPFTSAGK